VLKTPGRIVKSMAFLTKDTGKIPNDILRGALFDVDYDEMVIVGTLSSTPCVSTIMLPFIGKAHVAYIPQAR